GVLAVPAEHQQPFAERPLRELPLLRLDSFDQLSPDLRVGIAGCGHRRLPCDRSFRRIGASFPLPGVGPLVIYLSYDKRPWKASEQSPRRAGGVGGAAEAEARPRPGREGLPLAPVSPRRHPGEAVPPPPARSWPRPRRRLAHRPGGRPGRLVRLCYLRWTG